MSANLFKKGLIENPLQRLSLRTLTPNPIGVINRRNGCSSTIIMKNNEDTELG
ncbi:hypothetical protein [Methanosarcina sp. UBA5]|uniref:hypothetical protein n=1 Tax=Methanosarcina sp. UBA5 TaxID=1915593 RepID=UPI0025F1794B|nr:hypothetical protein [Methanosarcina sp. UBA5]